MAARSVDVKISNYSGVKLTRVNFDLEHGGWVASNVPPEVIEDNNASSFKSEEIGMATGVKGYVKYRVGDETSGGSGDNFLRINWHNPYLGSNSYSTSYPEGFRVIESGGKGNHASPEFVFLKDNSS